MFNTHKTYSVQSSLFAEKRLCRFDSPDRMQESMGAKEEIERNVPLHDVIKEYQTAFNKIQALNPEKHPNDPSVISLNEADREHFMTLVVNGILPNSQKLDYKSVQRNQLNATDPMDLLGKSDEELGRWVVQLFESFELKDRTSVSERLNSIFSSQNKQPILQDALNDSKDVKKLAAVGDVFKRYLATTTSNWQKGPANVIDQRYCELLALQYLKNKRTLEGMLRAKRIAAPSAKPDETEIARSELSRTEYRGLLLMLWQERDADVQKMLTGGVTGIRMGLNDKNNKSQTSRVDKIGNDLSMGAEAPGETLNRFGVVIGPIVLRDYMLMRTGAFNGKTNTPSDSAATWIDHPDRAYAFLINRLVATPANAEFLRALRFHLVLTDDERKSEIPTARPKMDADSTKKTLSLLVQQLVRREDLAVRTIKDREAMTKKEGFDETIEKQAANAWEYIKDIKEHPIGSAAIALVAYVALKSLWDTVRGKGSGFSKFLGVSGLVALGAAGLNGYAKHQTGSSLFDRAMQRYGQGANKKSPEKDTLTTYWNDRLKENKGDDLSAVESEKCLSLLQDKRVQDVLPWYEKMDLAMRDPSKQRPDLPFAIRNKNRLFGTKKNSEISELFYYTLKQFFNNRGQALARDPLFAGRGAVSGDHERGLAYIRMRYMNTREFNVLVEDKLKIDEIVVNGKKFNLKNITITEKDFTSPTDPTLIELKKALTPDSYAKILLGALIYRQAFAEDKTHLWTMSQVFLAEADPELLGGVSPDGSNVLSGLYHAVQDKTNRLAASDKNPPDEEHKNAPEVFVASLPLQLEIAAPQVVTINKPLSFVGEKPIIIESQTPLTIKVNGADRELEPNKPLTIEANSIVVVPVNKNVTVRSVDEQTPVKLKFEKI